MTENILLFIKKFIPPAIFGALQPVYHFLLAFIAALVYFFPSRKLKVIGVTGTDGKSSVVSLLHEIFRKSGRKAASFSSLRFKINDKEEPNMLKMTMPGRFFAQSFLRGAVNSGAEYAIVEVTSEGIAQSRHKFIKFEGAVLTNVTPEHIEAHGSFEKYRTAKSKLFKVLGRKGIAVLNRDDASCDFFQRHTRAKVNFYAKGGLTIDGVWHPVRNLSYQKEIRFSIEGVEFHSRLFGAFNVSNILAAVAAARSFGILWQEAAKALEGISGIPGRLEIIQEKPFRVVVDYAHTPNALRAVYKTVTELNQFNGFKTNQLINSSTHKLICVLGAAGGGRDKWKRPELGKIAGEFCNEIILANEDPYDESPTDIVEDIAEGLSSISNFQFPISKILDRREAIREALCLAKPGDTVIITGKGAEQWIMGPKNTKIPWDDRKALREEIEMITHR